MANLHPFVKNVLANVELVTLNDSPHFLLACSGGADSTALLCAFNQIKSLCSYKISVVTVNHNIRSAAESAADTEFVADLCQRLNIPCFVEDIQRGAVVACALRRRRGIEDAARVLRYGIFEKIADAIGADFIVTAHNQNDSYETALMRLFQGGNTAGLHTMPIRRGRYLRPLIFIERSSIEAFLRQHTISWCEDSTNADNVYLRNRIRHFLVPALHHTFGAWYSGLDKTLQRIALDSAFCTAALQHSCQEFGDTARWCLCKHGGLRLSAVFFNSLHRSLRLRMIEEGCMLLNIGERVPFGILFRMTEDVDCTKIIAAGTLRLEVRGAWIFLFNSKSYLALQKQRLYALTIEACGIYSYPLGQLEVYSADGGFFVKDCGENCCSIGPFTLPISIRTRRSSDRIRMSTGGCKEVKKILNEWSMDSLARDLLPIIIENNYIRALYGSPLGYKNWFVEEQ